MPCLHHVVCRAKPIKIFIGEGSEKKAMDFAKEIHGSVLGMSHKRAVKLEIERPSTDFQVREIPIETDVVVHAAKYNY